ncbi:uncharacterized protein LOC110714526 [Chenopodium quinoa]|uniref:uncharacterized protein LOC110714526 n=1 Tax=Chenopodium quinoa TaxID=63459 RepID=UPI000B7798E8|nr:uncharacterized protein LOC110714526 [Chenopodium quinoa]
MGKLEKQQKWSVNGVIVTVYEESSTSASGARKIRTITPKSTTPSCGYDRRADLLAYAHRLRNVGSQQIQHHHSHNSPLFSNLPNKPKRRRRWFARLKALKFSFGRLFGREKKKAWNYENVESKDRENRYRTSPYPRRGRGRCSKISKKLGSVLKQFSCGCKCSKGGFDRNDDQYQDLRNNS